MAFKRDLVIADVDPTTNSRTLYQIPEDVWRDPKFKAQANMAAELDAMLNQGAVVGTVPELGHIGAACYLLNIASLNIDPLKSS